MDSTNGEESSAGDVTGTLALQTDPAFRAAMSAIATVNRVWTPDCYEPDDFLALADQTAAPEEANAIRTHLSSCAYCQWVCAEALEFALEAPVLRTEAALSGLTELRGVSDDKASHNEVQRKSPALSRSQGSGWPITHSGQKIGVAISHLLAGRRILPPASLFALQAPTAAYLAPSRSVAELSSRPKVISPSGTLVLLQQPIFRWSAVLAAERYRLQVRDIDGVLAVDIEIPANGEDIDVAYDMVKGDRELRRRAIYRWTVAAFVSGSKISSKPEALFQVLDEERADLVLRQRSRDSEADFLLTLQLVEFGLLDEAEAALLSLINDRPQSKLANLLLTRVRNQRKAG